MVWYVRQKLTIELIYPLMDCCHIYMHDDLSVHFHFKNTPESASGSYKAICKHCTMFISVLYLITLQCTRNQLQSE